MENITDILLRWEQDPDNKYHTSSDTYKEAPGKFFLPTFPVITEPIAFSSVNEEIIVLSDLHIAAGKNELGVYQGTENFFADRAFERFIKFTIAGLGQQKALLVLNGDTFDFLRVTEYPGKFIQTPVSKKLSNFFYSKPPKPIVKPSAEKVNSEFIAWQQELEKVGITKTIAELEASISSREKNYGLETEEYKTIYKLMRIHQGHPAFFTALANWLSCGNRLLITKGNHDLEIVWPAIRHYIRLLLAVNSTATNTADVLVNTVLPNLFFADDAVLINGSFYIEHGHRYDKFAMVLDDPFYKKNPAQLNIPFGSFFNRYLINRVELFYPYLDKVRPTGNIVPILIRENFPLAIRIFGCQVPFVIRILFTNARYIWFMLTRVVPLLLVLLPIIIYGYVVFFSKTMAELRWQNVRPLSLTPSSKA